MYLLKILNICKLGNGANVTITYPSPTCLFCSEIDTVNHTIFEYKKRDEQRRNLKEEDKINLTMNNVTEKTKDKQILRNGLDLVGSLIVALTDQDNKF